MVVGLFVAWAEIMSSCVAHVTVLAHGKFIKYIKKRQ